MEEYKNGRWAALEVISKINAVQGFDPTAVTREVASFVNPGEKERFLPLIWKKAWARMVYPIHRCHAKITEIKDGMVAAYAAFYIDNDPGKEAIGEGFAFVSIDAFAADMVKARADAISKALGSAKSRAYTDAGFGLQFWIDDCIDDIQSIAIQQMTRGNQSLSIPVVEGDKVPAISEEAAGAEAMNKPVEVVQGGTPPKSRKTQYEVAKEANEELVMLSEQIADVVNGLMATAIGSNERRVAEKSLEAIRGKWDKISADIASKVQKPSVQEAMVKDSDYTFLTKTFDQVVIEAKMCVRSKMETQPEVEAYELLEEAAQTIEIEARQNLQNSQMTVFMMSLEEARNVRSTCGSYSGRTIGEIYEDKVTRQILPKLFERSADKKERLAIKTLITSDLELMAYCERNGKALEV